MRSPHWLKIGPKWFLRTISKLFCDQLKLGLGYHLNGKFKFVRLKLHTTFMLHTFIFFHQFVSLLNQNRIPNQNLKQPGLP